MTCRGENKNAYWVLVEKLKERDNFEDKGADGKTTLTRIVKEQDWRVCTGLIWTGTGESSGLL